MNILLIKINFVNKGSIDTISGGYLYNKEIINYLTTKDHQVIYTDCLAKSSDVDITIIDSLMIEELSKKNISSKSKMIGLIHMLDREGYQNSTLLNAYKSMHLITTGSQCYQELIEKYKVNKNDISLIKPGQNSNWKTKSSHSDSPTRLLCVANYLPGKGYDMLFEVLAKKIDLKWTLDIYGNKNFDTLYFKSLIKKSEILNIDSRIRFNGTVESREINNAMIQSDLLLHFSENESYGMVIKEAIQTRLPVLMYRTGEWKEFIKSKQVEVVENYSIGSFLKAIDRILTENKYYKNMCGVENYIIRPWSQVGQEFEQAIQKIHFV